MNEKSALEDLGVIRAFEQKRRPYVEVDQECEVCCGSVRIVGYCLAAGSSIFRNWSAFTFLRTC